MLGEKVKRVVVEVEFLIGHSGGGGPWQRRRNVDLQVWSLKGEPQLTWRSNVVGSGEMWLSIVVVIVIVIVVVVVVVRRVLEFSFNSPGNSSDSS